MVQLLPAVPAVVFLLSGAVKLIDLEHFEMSLESWDIIPSPLITLLVVVIPAVELALGVAYFVLRRGRAVVVWMWIVLFLFTIGFVAQIVFYKAPSCGCLGKIQIFESRRIESIFAIARNILLMIFLSPSLLARHAGGHA